MLSIDHIHFGYDSDQTILKDCLLHLQPDKIHGILGPNGSGKTTLLNILAKRLEADSGSVTLNGNQIRHSDIAFLETDPHFYPKITGREYLTIFQYSNPSFDIKRWNNLFNLPLSRLVDTYSSGMKKRLAFIGILSLDRPIILLDEPFNNLDIDANLLIAKLLRLLADKGKVVIFTSHVLEVLTNMTDCIHLLEEGSITETIEQESFAAWKESYRAREIEEQVNEAKALL